MFDKWLYKRRGEPEFCGDCGKKLEDKTYGIEYDRNTGDVVRVRRLIRCPNHWAFDAGSYHDCYSWTEAS